MKIKDLYLSVIIKQEDPETEMNLEVIVSQISDTEAAIILDDSVNTVSVIKNFDASIVEEQVSDYFSEAFSNFGDVSVSASLKPSNEQREPVASTAEIIEAEKSGESLFLSKFKKLNTEEERLFLIESSFYNDFYGFKHQAAKDFADKINTKISKALQSDLKATQAAEIHFGIFEVASMAVEMYLFTMKEIQDSPELGPVFKALTYTQDALGLSLKDVRFSSVLRFLKSNREEALEDYVRKLHD